MTRLPSDYRGGVMRPEIDYDEYIFGAATQVKHQIRVIDGKWQAYYPLNESQKFGYFDSYGCVSYSCLNSIEIQLNYLIESKQLGGEAMSWLIRNNYIKDGSINFDDRWLVVKSGTQPGRGNYIAKVWHTARKQGLIPQIITSSRGWTSDRYYTDDFSDRDRALAQDFLSYFEIQYERISMVSKEYLNMALMHAPIVAGLATCPGWGSQQHIRSCDQQPNHATLITGPDLDVYDSYDPYKKTLAQDYKIAFAYKGLVTPKKQVSWWQKIIPNKRCWA